MSYVSGFIVPVPTENKERYIASAREGWALFKEYGAVAQMEAWGDRVEDGKFTDFKRAVDLKDGETVVFSWIIWPDKATAEAAEKTMMEDPRMKDMQMPFDGKRMVWGGFVPIFQA